MADIRALILDVGVPFLEQRSTVDAVAESLRQTGQHESDPHVAEALAYSFLLMGETKAAEKMLQLLRRITLDDTDRAELGAEVSDPGEDDWVVDVGKRGTNVEETLARSPEDAIRLLDKMERGATERATAAETPERSDRPVIVYGIASAISGDIWDWYTSRDEAEATLVRILGDEPDFEGEL
jgi:hypothetical protein